MKVHKPFLLSAALNLVLISALAVLVLQKNSGHEAQISRPSAPPLSEDAIAGPRPESSPSAIQPFHWSQLESADYPTYIANLRAIGCPEQTIRDIITADVAGNATGILPREKAGVVALLLGTNSPGVNPPTGGSVRAANDSQPGRTAESVSLGAASSSDPDFSGLNSEGQTPGLAGSDIRLRQRRVSVPLIFQNPDSVQDLNDLQQSVANQLRQSFVDAVGGENQDPADPQYVDRWQDAQLDSDQLFKLMFGVQAYLQKQRLAGQQRIAQGDRSVTQ